MLSGHGAQDHGRVDVLWQLRKDRSASLLAEAVVGAIDRGRNEVFDGSRAFLADDGVDVQLDEAAVA